ncbi:MAG: hypothetical protein JWP97_6697 [Labilithrix sp.]|nr:hypothetical protein [Labilithrix sp.]
MLMKHVFSFAFLGLSAAALAGCPIYSDDAHSNRVCVGSDCYSCPDDYVSDSCYGYSCYGDSDCPSGYSCGSNSKCQYTGGKPPPPTGGTSCTVPTDCPVGATCGSDNTCHTGDCSTAGCPSAYVCKLTNGSPSCQAASGGGSTSTCSKDADCSTPGAKCLSGTCVNAPDQCADGTQCAAGSQCVGGECTPSCSSTKACPTGYTCDEAKGVCTGNPTTCTSSSQCSGGTVCVQQHCVDSCGPGSTCPSGLVCVDGGCTPDEKPVFTCATDGVQDKCQAGSLCLRHSCYISCDPQVTDACKSADNFNVCKTVTTSSGDHSVCGSSSNLGTECDPTQGKTCPTAGAVCIDGYCK